MLENLLELPYRLLSPRSSHWVRPVIVLLVLGGSYILGRQASTELITMIVAGMTALVFMRWPMAAIPVIVVASLFIPFGIGTGTLTSINITVLLVILVIGLWLADMMVRQRRIWIYRSRVVPPALAFVLVSVLSFLTGQLPWFAFAGQVSLSAQLGGLALFLLSIGAFIWIGQHVTEIKWLKLLVWSYVGFGGIFMLGRLFPILQLDPLFLNEATGSLFWVWVIALATSQAFFNPKLTIKVRLGILTVAFLTMLVGWINRSWASGWVPGLIAFVVIVFLLNWRLGLLAGSLLLIAFLGINLDYLTTYFRYEQFSLFTRQEAWRIVFEEIVRVNPILGLGPANYYNYTPLFPILGYNVRFNSHNQYVDLIAQTGFLGLVIFLWLAFEIGLLAWRLKNHLAPGFARAYAIGVLGGLVGTLAAGMLGDWIIPFIYNIRIDGFRTSVFGWLFLGGLVVIERLLNQNQAAPE